MLDEDILTPVACKYCDSRFVTLIEFDFIIHLTRAHNIGRGWLDTPPTPSTPSKSWSSDFRIIEAIQDGVGLGKELDEKSLKSLDLEYHKPKSKHQLRKQETPIVVNFRPIISVDNFFRDDDKPYSALKNHSLEQSPCYPIINTKPFGVYTLYSCDICRKRQVSSIDLSPIEHHCKYKDPDIHKSEILTRLAKI